MKWGLSRGALVVAASVLMPIAAWGADGTPAAPAVGGATTPTLFETVSIGDMQQLLQDLGYRAQVVTNDGPAAYLKSQSQNATFFVNFYDCVEEKPSKTCNSVEFVTATFTARPAPEPKAMSTWNRDNWWAFGVYDDQGGPYLRMYLSSKGGVTADYLKNMIELWDWRLQEFGKFIDTTAAAAKPAAP